MYPPSLADFLQLLRRIVGLHRFGLDDYRGVAFLPCFASGGDSSCHVAGRGGYRHYADDYYFSHVSPFFFLLLCRILSDNFGHLELIPSNRPQVGLTVQKVCLQRGLSVVRRSFLPYGIQPLRHVHLSRALVVAFPCLAE